MRLIFFCLLALVASACGPNDTLLGASETGGTDGIEEAQSTLPAEAVLETQMFNGALDVVAKGAEWESSIETYTSDDSGIGRLRVPSETPFVVEMSHPAYLPVRVVGFAVSEQLFEQRVPLVEVERYANVIYFGTDMPLREGKGHVSIEVRDGAPGGGDVGELLTDATLSLNVDAETVARTDYSWAWGVSEGSSPEDGFVFFANVEPGPVSVSVEPPPGTLSCGLAPGAMAAPGTIHEVEVLADTITSLLIVCW